MLGSSRFYSCRFGVEEVLEVHIGIECFGYLVVVRVGERYGCLSGCE
jgi:hypothetical protein